MSRRKKEEPNNVRDNEHLTDTGADTSATPKRTRPKRPKVNQKIAKLLRPSVKCNNDVDNDKNWYNLIKSLFNDVTNLSFNDVLGLYTGCISGKQWISSTGKTGTPGTTTNARTIPGIMAINLAPTMGLPTSQTSAANIGGQQIYSLMRQKISLRNTYDYTDVMITIGAMGNAYMLYEELLRGYRSLCSFNYANRYFPNTVLKVLGYSNNLATNLADFRALLDLFAYKLGSINIPAQFTVLKRQSWLFTNIYTDSKGYKAQMYVFRPDGYFVYDETTDSNGGRLNYMARESLYTGNSVEYQNGNADYFVVESLEQVKNAIDTIMEPLLGSADIGNISSDLAKAFSDDLIKIAPVEDHPWLEPAYSAEVLTQIENMEWCMGINQHSVQQVQSNPVSGPYLKETLSVAINDALISSGAHAMFQRTLVNGARNHLINMHMDKPTPDDNMVATRLKWTAEQKTPVWDSTKKRAIVNVASCGTEIATGVSIYTMDSSTASSIARTSLRNDVLMRTVPAGSGTAYTYEFPAEIVNPFDWCPTMYLWNGAYSLDNGDYSVAGLNLQGVSADVDNYLYVTDDDIRRINEVAVMSEYAAKSFHGNAL